MDGQDHVLSKADALTKKRVYYLLTMLFVHVPIVHIVVWYLVYAVVPQGYRKYRVGINYHQHHHFFQNYHHPG